MDGFGSVTWWGFSPALNLEEQWTANSLVEGLLAVAIIRIQNEEK